MVQKNNLCSTPKVHGGEKNVDIYKLFKSDSQKTKRQQREEENKEQDSYQQDRCNLVQTDSLIYTVQSQTLILHHFQACSYCEQFI